VLSRSIRFALTRSKIPGGTLLIRILSAVRFAASVAWNCAALCFRAHPYPLDFAVLFISNPRYFFEASEGIRASAPGAGTLVFFHMVIFRNLLETVLLAAQCGRKWKTPAVLLFRYRPRCAARIVSRRGWRFTFSSGWFRKDLYASPPTVIARDRLRRSHVDPDGGSSDSPWTGGREPSEGLTPGRRRIRFASLGNARAEKGILEIIRAIQL